MKPKKLRRSTIKFNIIIPARYAATRLPGKPLREIHGKPLIQHVYESALASDADRVYIATDDERIRQCAKAFGAQAIITRADHLSGTDRLTEAAVSLGLDDDEIVVNLQGDEVGTPAAIVNQVANNLRHHPDHAIATLCEPLEDSEACNDPHTVKVVFDCNHSALYFSRACVPHPYGGQGGHFRHIGIYAYRVAYLKQFSATAPSRLELSESLEQLRALEAGEKIHVDMASASAGVGVDTEEDLARVVKAESGSVAGQEPIRV